MNTKRLTAAVCALVVFGAGLGANRDVLPTVAVSAADTYQTRDPFYNFSSGYNYYTSEHFQFIWGNSGDAAQVTQEFLQKNAASLETCWDWKASIARMQRKTSNPS